MSKTIIFISLTLLLVFFAPLSIRADDQSFGKSEHVLLIGIDGLGGSYLKNLYETNSLLISNIAKLISSGSYTFEARGNMPTNSKPNWSAVLSGGDPEETGEYSNNWFPPSNRDDLSKCFFNEKDAAFFDDKCGLCNLCLKLAKTTVSFKKNSSDYEIYSIMNNYCDSLTEEELKVTNEEANQAKELCKNVVYTLSGRIYDFINQESLTPDEVCSPTYLGKCQNEIPPVKNMKLFPTIFSVLKNQNAPNFKTALYTDHNVVLNFIEPDVADTLFLAQPESDQSVDITQMTDRIVKDFKDYKMNFTFVHYDQVDHSGHAYSWGSNEYNNSILLVDEQIGKLMEGLKNADIKKRTLVMIVADHGGTLKDHGIIPLTEQLLVPFIISGPGVMQNATIKSYTRLVDTSPTALYALGYQQPSFWIGKPVFEAFVNPNTDLPNFRPECTKVKRDEIPLIDRVVLFALPGLTDRYIEKGHALNFFIEHGAFTNDSRPVLNFSPFPNLASLLYGAGPEEHGVFKEGWLPPQNKSFIEPISDPSKKYPSIFTQLKKELTKEKESAKTIHTSACFQRKEIDYLIDEQDLDFKFIDSQNNFESNVVGEKCLQALLNETRHGTSNVSFSFVEYEILELTGNQYGFLSGEYLEAFKLVDGFIGWFVNQLSKNNLLNSTMIIIASTNGGNLAINVGQSKSYAVIEQPDLLFESTFSSVPWIAYHPYFNKTDLKNQTVRVYDTASTILDAFLVPQNEFTLGSSLLTCMNTTKIATELPTSMQDYPDTFVYLISGISILIVFLAIYLFRDSIKERLIKFPCFKSWSKKQLPKIELDDKVFRLEDDHEL